MVATLASTEWVTRTAMISLLRTSLAACLYHHQPTVTNKERPPTQAVSPFSDASHRTSSKDPLCELVRPMDCGTALNPSVQVSTVWSKPLRFETWCAIPNVVVLNQIVCLLLVALMPSCPCVCVLLNRGCAALLFFSSQMCRQLRMHCPYIMVRWQDVRLSWWLWWTILWKCEWHRYVQVHIVLCTKHQGLFTVARPTICHLPQ